MKSYYKKILLYRKRPSDKPVKTDTKLFAVTVGNKGLEILLPDQLQLHANIIRMEFNNKKQVVFITKQAHYKLLSTQIWFQLIGFSITNTALPSRWGFQSSLTHVSDIITLCVHHKEDGRLIHNRTSLLQ